MWKNDNIDSFASDKWTKIKEKSLLWKGLDKFGSVFDTINWDNGPKGLYIHSSCLISLSSSRKLEQLKKRSESLHGDESMELDTQT